jgi:hypothetical protein
LDFVPLFIVGNVNIYVHFDFLITFYKMSIKSFVFLFIFHSAVVPIYRIIVQCWCVIWISLSSFRFITKCSDSAQKVWPAAFIWRISWTGVSRLEFGMKLNYTEAANYIRYIWFLCIYVMVTRIKIFIDRVSKFRIWFSPWCPMFDFPHRSYYFYREDLLSLLLVSDTFEYVYNIYNRVSLHLI